jgi:hypothetical protein
MGVISPCHERLWSYLMHNWHVHIIYGTSSCFEFWWFELMVNNVIFKFVPVDWWWACKYLNLQARWAFKVKSWAWRLWIRCKNWQICILKIHAVVLLFFSYYQLIEQTLILKLNVLQELILFKLSKMASFHAKFYWNTNYLFQ